jgi:hypothetical protein
LPATCTPQLQALDAKPEAECSSLAPASTAQRCPVGLCPPLAAEAVFERRRATVRALREAAVTPLLHAEHTFIWKESSMRGCKRLTSAQVSEHPAMATGGGGCAPRERAAGCRSLVVSSEPECLVVLHAL